MENNTYNIYENKFLNDMVFILGKKINKKKD